jgi:16S rRNA processing protein RimM
VPREPDRPAAGGRLVVGLVRGVQGLKGTVRVEVLSDVPARFDAGSVLHAEGSDQPLTIVESRPDGRGLLVRFAEVASREAADQLRDVYLETESAAELPPQAHFWHEVIGCTVQTRAGVLVGRVEDVFRVGGSEVYEVHGPRGEVLVPAVESVVVELAPAAGRIVVDGAALGLDEANE